MVRHTEPEPLDWTEAGPRSRRFDDVYYANHDGLAEARAVFLGGCGLPKVWADQGWEGARSFVVGELGFGVGLNIVALLDLWGRARPCEGQLHIFSVEAFLMGRDDAARALAAWPELADIAAELLVSWPDDRQGFHRIDFPGHAARLDLWIGDVQDGLRAWGGQADAWFLDGFAPSRNVEMWRTEVLNLVAARSRPGARLATFTVAGEVRRGLQAAGFSVEKRPGFGRKRERLEACRAGDEPSALRRPRRVAIIGAGIAGAALARAFRNLGADPTVVDAVGPGAGASGNPAALVTPGLDAGFGPLAVLHGQALARAAELYGRETPDAIIARGAVQLESTPRDAARFDRVADWSGFASDAVVRISAMTAANRLREPRATSGLHYRDALVVEPSVILRAWLPECERVDAEVSSLSPQDQGWRLLDAQGRLLLDVDTVVLAAGPACARLATGFPLLPVRGQASWTHQIDWEGQAATGSGYAVPLRHGILFGASHVRHDWADDIRPEEASSNLARLAEVRPRLAERVSARLDGVEQRASIRAATPDHRPLAGALPGRRGLFILSGLGGRGFTLAPLLAEHVAALAVQIPSPLPNEVARIVDPARYSVKDELSRP